MNPMREIRLEKLTLNMGAGESGPKVEKSKTILEKITGKKVVITKTHKRTTFGMAQKRDIGVRVTLRGKEAKDLLKRLLEAVENRLKPSQFDASGNFSFGVHEYIHIPGIKYDPDVGILGMDVCVTLERPGFRVKRKNTKSSKVGKKHKITPADAMEWVKKEFKGEVKEEE
ncbi:MAG: 50S ribosomal protein L5 [Candidatus Aenigmatarchaeota archaeon]|nr:MAG: 50S ribosomal protein L5 [Candidatus Aenigmarchaeota archaeon]